jgi:hypothetical protein
MEKQRTYTASHAWLITDDGVKIPLAQDMDLSMEAPRENAPPVFYLTTMDPGTFPSPPGPPPGVAWHFVDEDGTLRESVAHQHLLPLS